MTSTCFNRPGRALVAAMLAVVAFEFLPEARAFIVPEGLPLADTNGESWNSTNSAPVAIPRRASIILIVADGLGYGDLSCYGQAKFQTPNLDKLAAEGIRFTNYSVTGASLQSHAALVFGKNSGGEISVAQILKNSGYHTGLVGEWNLGDENSGGAPWKKGFDEFAGYLDANDAANFYADYMWRLIPNFSYDESYNDKISGHWREWNKADGPPAPGREMIYANTQGKSQFIPDLFSKAALNFVQNNLPDQFNRWRPFFLLLNFKIPAGKIEVPTDAPFSEEPWPQPEKNRAALISRIDGYVGQLQEQLQKIGMTNNVVIFFSSASVPEKSAEIAPGFFRSNISTNDFRVPMIARWPGKIPAGQTSDYKWSAQDFLPTAAQIAFANPPANIDGTSVLPALLGQARK